MNAVGATCQCGQLWPCDTATVIAALDEATAIRRPSTRERVTWWKDKLAAAEAREARLREALDRIADMAQAGGAGSLGQMEAIARAALSPEAEP